MSAKERLAEALTEAGAPQSMVDAARRGHYDDFESDVTFPIMTLVRDCEAAGLLGIADRAKDGEFDAE